MDSRILLARTAVITIKPAQQERSAEARYARCDRPSETLERSILNSSPRSKLASSWVQPGARQYRECCLAECQMCPTDGLPCPMMRVARRGQDRSSLV